MGQIRQTCLSHKMLSAAIVSDALSFLRVSDAMTSLSKIGSPEPLSGVLHNLQQTGPGRRPGQSHRQTLDSWFPAHYSLQSLNYEAL